MMYVFVMLCFVCNVLAQGYLPPPTCSSEKIELCVSRCSCTFCTKNETLANEILNGTIPTNFSNNQGYCIEARETCPHQYYSIPGSDVSKCGSFMAVVVVLGVLTITLFGCAIHILRPNQSVTMFDDNI